MAQQAKLSRYEFQQKYTTEEACEQALFQMKWPEGYRCDKCGSEAHSTVRTRKLPLYQCNKCGYQATVTVNTILEKTRTPLAKWFIAIYSMATDKRGYSATQLSKDIEVSYPTAWSMLHKIRVAMGNTDSEYQLSCIVEMDESYFGGPDEGGKRGRGTEKTKVMVGLSLNEHEHPRFAKMEVIEDVKGQTILEFARRNVVPGSVISSDDFISYDALDAEYLHISQTFFLKWLHVIVANAKALIQGIFHGLDSKYFQRYLNEFCYRFNRRDFDGQGFFRLLKSCVSSPAVTWDELTS